MCACVRASVCVCMGERKRNSDSVEYNQDPTKASRRPRW